MRSPINAIYVGSQKVRPAWWWWGWQPWADTLVYLPLATNSNDQSWNWNNGVNTNITFSDNKAVFNSNWTSCILIDNTSLPTVDYTLHMIVARTTDSGYQVAFRYSDGSGYDNARCYISGYWTFVSGDNTCHLTDLSVCNSSARFNVWFITSDTTEHLLSFVVYENNGGVYNRYYIDGVYQAQKSASANYYPDSKISFWNRWYNKNEWLRGTMREVILEDKVRTDAEVLALAQQFWFA